MLPGDTIAAISTAPGEAAIGVVRLSGPGAISLAGRLFHPFTGRAVTDLPSHTVHLGEIRVPETGDAVDQALLTVFQAPRSYTGEDVVEISAHGSPVALHRILTLVLAHGARLAHPGEFTCRAFLNGKIDLAQAEAVNDIIRARTDRGLGIAFRQLEGRLSAMVREARAPLLALLAHIEATIDFPEDVPEMDASELLERMDAALAIVENLLSGAHAGRIYRDGVRVVIAGRPNVGKSSLLNALLREDRAIVTEIPGTTRDVIEEGANIRGIPLRTIDTAGLHEPRDPVEAIGVQRARDQIAAADLVLAVLDASEPLASGDLEVLALAGERPCVVVANKCDLAIQVDPSAIGDVLPGAPVFFVSARERTGIPLLEERVAEIILGGAAVPRDGVLVGSARHQAALEVARDAIRSARDTLETGLPLELATTDLRDALDALGRLTGESVPDEILAEIFDRFCLGK